MASNTTTEMIMLRSSDGELFEVPETVARQSQVINRLIDDMNYMAEGIHLELTVIPVHHATAKVLAKVLTYCKKHAEAADATKTEKTQEDSSSTPASNKELDNWDKQFIDVDQAMLYKLLMAANYLEIDGLLDLACQNVADMIQGKKPEEIREILNIENDFTAEEEMQVCLENQWAYQC